MPAVIQMTSRKFAMTDLIARLHINYMLIVKYNIDGNFKESGIQLLTVPMHYHGGGSLGTISKD